MFIGTGAPKGKDLNLKGREISSENIHIGIDWLTSIAFEHVKKIGKKVVVIGGGNTAMDCCRSALRLGATDVKVTVRSPFSQMKASEWEIEETMEEGIPILDNTSPKEFLFDDKGKLCGVKFEKMEQVEIDGRKKNKREKQYARAKEQFIQIAREHYRNNPKLSDEGTVQETDKVSQD